MRLSILKKKGPVVLPLLAKVDEPRQHAAVSANDEF
ncbi:MAG: hypothetical protein ACI9KE_000907 [Polyangiales bacterium]|jgi:hypothetical protein